DTAVIGQLGSETLMGAVAIAAIVFNQIYWVFGFLKMGTSGFTAQASGANDWSEIAAHLSRASLIGIVLGIALIATQALVGPLLLWLMGASDGVAASAMVYFDIRIWGAPAALVNFALLGWFIGLGRSDIVFWLQLLLNVTNIGLAILFVISFGWGVAGAGLSILLAELIALAAGLAVAVRFLRAEGAELERHQVFDAVELKRMFAVNGDIMIRTFCLLFAFAVFTRQGAVAGDLTLAINALLFSIAMISAYLLDGFAFAAETFVGRSVGARDRRAFDRAVELTTLWAAIFAVIITVALFAFGGWMIELAAVKPEIRDGAMALLAFAACVPLVGVWCFQLDGVFIGATQSRDMRNMMLISLAVFVVTAWGLVAAFGNIGLWLALYVFFVVRAITLYARLHAVRDRAFAE
ncbi:MAG: MATE family efflux transporter, partial [Pseudomonadota bacterium]